MSRVLICANTMSGKTTFMYGTFHQMMKGIYGFTLIPKHHFAQFNRQCKRIGDTRLPLNERFPAPSDKIEEYHFLLKYNLKTIDEIQWIDYPGNLVEEDENNPDNVRLMEYMKGTDCLFLCIDGAHFNHDTRTGILSAINRDGGGMELNYMLNRAAENARTGADQGLPPVCMIITKYDLVEPDKRSETFLLDILKEVFPILFHPSSGGSGRLVSVCPVTLGRDIGKGGKLEPKNIEKPFCYLTFLRQASVLKQYDRRMELLRGQIGAFRRRTEPLQRYRLARQVLSYWPAARAQEELVGLEEQYRHLEHDLVCMKQSLENMALFDNGRQIPWENLIRRPQRAGNMSGSGRAQEERNGK